RVVNAGIRIGRDAEVQDLQAAADVGLALTMLGVIATRGDRLALTRIQDSGPDGQPGWVQLESLLIVEIDADQLLRAAVAFDLDDVDAAFAELDAHYIAGEAAAHAHVWSVIARECARFNRHELPAADWVTIDHRQLAVIDAREGQAAMRDIWEVTPNLSMHIETVHQLSSSGAVSSYVASGTSPEGVDAEWPMILLLTVEGDRINRCEIFDEDDLDAALAHFEELQPPTPRLENMASQVDKRFWEYFAARDWTALATALADDMINDDRRRIVNAGIRRGRDFEVANMRTLSDLGVTNITSTVIATRGERLLLRRTRFSLDQGPEDFHGDLLCIVELDAENRIATRVLFDPDDIDVAFAELDARYLAGAAVQHSHTWSLISGIYAGFNRHELPATSTDFAYVDHRPLITIAASDLPASIRAVWDLTPEISIYIEAVHRLSDVGAVVTHTARGISHEDFDAEWRMIDIFTVDGDVINRCEMFDESDLGDALARFDELSPPMPP
ncbi:MAG: BTAD domain-containing putative transcriptional regulator, partial [Ilumatobacteraceae bacterium]